MMLAHGMICRLGVPKTSARDLPQLARFLQRTLLARNASNIPAVRALSHAYRSALNARRSYATATSATKPTATVKKAIKAKAASKTPSKTKATAKTAKKPARKTAVVKVKPAAKKKAKKAAPKKPAPKKRVKKVLTSEAQEKAKIKELRKKALREPFSPGPLSAYIVFIAEQTKGKSQDGTATSRLTDASGKWKSLTPAEHEHYNHLAREQTAAKQAEYRAWIQTHTPQQILDANNARLQLRKILKTGAGKRKHPIHTSKLVDDRQPKRQRNSYALFFAERRSSGDFKGIKSDEAGKLIAEEWKALSAGEKKKYQDEGKADKARYMREKAATY